MRERTGIWKEGPLHTPQMSTSLSEDPILPFLTVPQKAGIQTTLTKHGQPEELCLTLPCKAHSLITELEQSTHSSASQNQEGFHVKH